MNARRKQARDYLKEIRTVKEFRSYIDELALSDEEKAVAEDMFIKGLSHTEIAFKYNFSIEKSKKIIRRVLSKV